jgi:hypothetical protein
VFIGDVTIAAGEQVELKHGLNRQLRGVLPSVPAGDYGAYMIISATKNAIVIESQYDVEQAGFWCF